MREKGERRKRQNSYPHTLSGNSKCPLVILDSSMSWNNIVRRKVSVCG